MHLSQIININSVYIDSFAQSKTAVLFKLSQLLSQNYPPLNSQDLFDAYWKRENLGSTAIGQGITIPHIRVAGINIPRGGVIKLTHPVDFGAEDKQPVDLVIGFVVPQQQVNQHLFILKAIIQQFSVGSFRKQCRLSTTPEKLYNLIAGKEVTRLEEPVV